MLDHYGAGIARSVQRREADKECVVAVLPGPVLVARDTGVALGLADAANLAGTGLPGHGPGLVLDAGCIGRAAPVVNH